MTPARAAAATKKRPAKKRPAKNVSAKKNVPAKKRPAKKSGARGQAFIAGAPDPGVDLGVRLHELRRRRRMTLREVADVAGISESFLSQVERMAANMSISTLHRVAAALNCSIVDLFDENHGSPVVLRKGNRPRLDVGNFETKFLITPRPFLDIEAFVAVLDVGGSTGDEPHTHGDSEELILVLAGSVTAQIGENTYEMEEGDSARYRTSVPHRVYNHADEPAEVLWVIGPPG